MERLGYSSRVLTFGKVKEGAMHPGSRAVKKKGLTKADEMVIFLHPPGKGIGLRRDLTAPVTFKLFCKDFLQISSPY